MSDITRYDVRADGSLDALNKKLSLMMSQTNDIEDERVRTNFQHSLEKVRIFLGDLLDKVDYRLAVVDTLFDILGAYRDDEDEDVVMYDHRLVLRADKDLLGVRHYIINLLERQLVLNKTVEVGGVRGTDIHDVFQGIIELLQSLKAQRQQSYRDINPEVKDAVIEELSASGGIGQDAFEALSDQWTSDEVKRVIEHLEEEGYLDQNRWTGWWSVPEPYGRGED